MFLSCTRGYLRLLDIVKFPITQVPFSAASQHLISDDSVPFPSNASSVIIDIIVTITVVSVSIGHVLPASVSGPLLVLSLEQKQLSSGPPCQQNRLYLRTAKLVPIGIIVWTLQIRSIDLSVDLNSDHEAIATREARS